MMRIPVRMGRMEMDHETFDEQRAPKPIEPEPAEGSAANLSSVEEPALEGVETDDRSKYLRAAAELRNVLQRTRREVDGARRQERERVLQAFLPVLDNFDRAIAAQGAEENPWIAGFRGTYDQMLEVMKDLGARPFSSVGHPFDPNRHEALATVPASARFEPGTVVEEVRTGYEMEDGTVLRPTQVLVAH